MALIHTSHHHDQILVNIHKHTYTRTLQSTSCYQLNYDPDQESKWLFQGKSQPWAKNTDRHTRTHPHTGNQVTQSDKCTDQENTQSLLLHLLYYTQ